MRESGIYCWQVGTVWVNSHGIIDAGVPFSGWKQSGIGILGGKGGLLEFLQYQGVRTNMTTEHVEYKSFGATPDISAVSCPPSVCQQNDNGVVDCTYKLYYGGAYKRPDGNSSLVVFDGTGKVYGSIAEGNRKDVRNAVEAALKAQPVWWKLGAHLRSQILYNTAEKLQLRREDFISHLTVLYGKADREFATKELDACQRVLFHWAASCDKKHVSTGEISPNNNFATIINREPMGVIGAVQTPIQSPPGPLALLNFVSMFAPAVCYGNSIVVIADSVHPTPAVEFCEVLDCSDFPAGVVNVLTGDTKYLAAQLASHQEVAALWAPGIEATTAKYIEWASSANMKDTWVDRLPCFDNLEQVTDCSELFELHSIRYKSIWIPCEEIYAN
ncbi:hypothetical protein ANN_06552 [Periplaneta americana]|uniref:Aldehyde dehydrogenase domain-containing protein n=1 Tax=Periplaneta americana TaxID=6978 RepID=A0ABQ8TFW3_PERAM|nr:hypothetical protein ANN_06552 [Periplaneta americana]